MSMSKGFIGAALLSLAAVVAQAHTHLKSATPADGSTVQTAPERITLTFSEPARVTALTIQKDGEPEQKLAPLPSESAAEVSVPAPKLAPGKYTVSWRVVSADSHIMSGKLHFTVAGA
ncbi:MAG TPA: copper resistance CopC family protein [Steroidobacteraceae bacterium]|jgi:methionine-rich copper-binding protein CopC|nr:copper resistance CopC family protein [Steroidobacteraceae bacterium]